MSWRDIMPRVLPPIEGMLPYTTSAYGVMRRKGPHGGVDFNYPGGQAGINLMQPTLHKPAGLFLTRGQYRTKVLELWLHRAGRALFI
jgi:hypothetical protein